MACWEVYSEAVGVCIVVICLLKKKIHQKLHDCLICIHVLLYTVYSSLLPSLSADEFLKDFVNSIVSNYFSLNTTMYRRNSLQL